MIPQALSSLCIFACAELGRAVELVVSRRRGGNTMPKAFPTEIVVPGTAGQVGEAQASDLANSGRYWFVAEEMLLLVASGLVTARLELRVVDPAQNLNEVLVGEPNRTAIGALVTLAGVASPSGVLRIKPIRISPSGGFRAIVESGGTSGTVYLVARGYWELEQESA